MQEGGESKFQFNKKVDSNINQQEEEEKLPGDLIRESIPISETLAEEINNSEWVNYSKMIEKEEELAKKYNKISYLSELSPYIMAAIKEDPDVENKLIESIKRNLEQLPLRPLNPLKTDIEAKKITKEFLETGNIRADTLQNTTVLYNALLKDAKIFQNRKGEYTTLKNFSEKNYFGESIEAPDIDIKCIIGQEHDIYSKKFGESLGLKEEELTKFIESKKNIPAYILTLNHYINNQLAWTTKEIIFNQRANLNLGVIIGAGLHEFGHNIVDKFSGIKKISLEILPSDAIAFKIIDEGIPEDFTQDTLKSLDEIYKNKGFDLLAVNRQTSSLEAEDIPHKYGNSIVHVIRENSPNKFKTENLPKLLNVISGEVKIGEIKLEK